jgi:glycosyltransferase involved in cell wall biosynthesis
LNNLTKTIFIGAINENHQPLGGEEYKNQLIISLLKQEKIDLVYFDTYSWKCKPLFIFRLLCTLVFQKVDRVVISASSVSTYRLLQIIHAVKPRLLIKCTYVVIGGYFPEAIESRKFNKRIYELLNLIIVEGHGLRKRLESVSSSLNIKVVPNFKAFPELTSILNDRNAIFKFIFVGRISQAKGVQHIIDSTNQIQHLYPSKPFNVDFYGPKEEEFEYNESCNYKGYLNFIDHPEKSYTHLMQYDCMLFPTTWKGEGFPGVIIDAFIAGLPVIATDWNMNTEIIEDGVNGYIIPSNNVQALTEKMIWVMENPTELENIGITNREKSKNYHIDTVWPELMKAFR